LKERVSVLEKANEKPPVPPKKPGIIQRTKGSFLMMILNDFLEVVVKGVKMAGYASAVGLISYGTFVYRAEIGGAIVYVASGSATLVSKTYQWGLQFF
jgi:hypothetical protein